MRRIRSMHVAIAALVMSGCSSGDNLTSPGFAGAPGALFVSNAVPDAPVGSPDSAWHAYVSLVPGSIPGGRAATLRNRDHAVAERVSVVDGGVDPIRMPGEPGDTLVLAATDSSGSTHEFVGFLKREPVPPVVVRTEPAQGVTDAPML